MTFPFQGPREQFRPPEVAYPDTNYGTIAVMAYRAGIADARDDVDSVASIRLHNMTLAVRDLGPPARRLCARAWINGWNSVRATA